MAKGADAKRWRGEGRNADDEYGADDSIDDLFSSAEETSAAELPLTLPIPKRDAGQR